MRRGFCVAALLVVIAWPALADDKTDPEPKPKDADKDAVKLISLGQVAGVLTSTGGSESWYTIKVMVRTVEPNLQAQANLPQKQLDLLKRQAEIMRNRNPLQRQQQLVQLMAEAQKGQQDLFRIKEVPVDIPAVPADDMKVRLAQPPDAFDDKGNIKRYTAKELKELRGPEGLPGYAGTLDDVKSKQIVIAYLARKPVKPKDPKDKDGDKPAEKDNVPVISMLVIVGEKK